MAASTSGDLTWHSSLSVLPKISGDAVDRFVSLQAIAQETSLRGYKFFLESYIHDVKGKSLY